MTRASPQATPMKPVLILQHLDADGPAYLRTWLQREGRSFEVFNTEAGQVYPARVQGYAALAVLGGEMSANDPLPSLRDAERLILDAMDHDVPVIGHCLGGQLMARALGARVVDSPAAEIGWHRIDLSLDQAAQSWFGLARRQTVFQWHYDAFELPSGAHALARSEACPVQAFGIGPHLAMQFHVELDKPKLLAWLHAHDERFVSASHAPAVQTAAEMKNGTALYLEQQHALADRVYTRWLSAAAF